MSVIKQYLIECGYTEEFLDSTDVRFDEPKLISLIEKWQHQPSLRRFVQFAARFHLTPYSGNRECLLFKLEVSGSSVRNTVIGGFNGTKQEFEFAGTRLNPEKVSSALSSNAEWLIAASELESLAQQLGVYFDEREQPTPKYFWVKMNRSDIDSVLEQLIDKWLIGVQGAAQLNSVSLEEYFTQVFESREGNSGEWIQEYRAYNKLSVEEKASTDLAIKELWTKASTWVASIKNGIMSGDDYRKSELDLIEFTQRLTQAISPELYNQSVDLLNRLADEGKISRRYWATTNRVFASLYPTKLSTIVAEDALRKVYQYLDVRFQLKLRNPSPLNWYELNRELLRKIQPILANIMDTDAINVTLWYIYESLTEIPSSETSEVREPASNYGEKRMNVPLNQIFYGPPGTGKTYHTIEAAVQAAEPDFYASLDIDAEVGATEAQRDSLTQKYQSLTDAGRIRFVTFHQSYGYEEFVEGLKANSEEGEISYDVEKGIFRQICDQAAKHTTERAASKTHSFELSWQAFSEQLAEKESLEITMSQTSFRVIDFNAKRIFFEKSNGKKDHTLSINTLKEIFEGARDYTSGLGVYYNPLVRYLKDLVPIEQKQAIKRQNYVLVIDEINRGNISKIFGELITLIEPSKRKGADEELELQLPLSRADEKFSVPDNLHIIGTMNTADRSLAMMDTALRRRFDFVEMMPRADLFSDHRIEWQQQKINLQSLLEALNKRIEVLYDREHTLGHAFLFPAYNAAKSGNHERAFVELKAAFKNKIIPLLEEYFYEDWNKIRLVLGDSLKQEESLRFLQKKEDSYTDLFGPNHGLDLYEDSKVTYSIKPFRKGSVWDNPQAYKAIYAQESE